MSKRRKAAVAFVTGLAIFVSSAGAMIAGGAAAHGPGNFIANLVNVPLAPTTDPQFAHGSQAKSIHIVSFDNDDQPRRRRHARVSTAAKFSARQPVCVRLCDGYFFPSAASAGVNDVKGQEAQCSSLCPDAPTEVYYRGGSDRIEDATSPRGELYSALPVSLRYRASQSNACTCHRDLVTTMSPLRDTTLRHGDAVMTPAGFLVFKGVEGVAHKLGDFAALGAASLSKDQRSTLQALERVSVLPSHPSVSGWLAAIPASGPVAASPSTASRVAARQSGKPGAQDSKIRLVEANNRPTY